MNISENQEFAYLGTLEHWDPVRRRWIMYRRPGDHSADCEKYPFEEIPGCVFLDTSVINLIIKYAPTIFEMEPHSAGTPRARCREIEALMHIFAVGQRMGWPMRASRKTMEEVSRTASMEIRERLASFVSEIIETGTVESDYGENLGRRVADSALLAALPDRSDRELLGNAIGLGCNAFITTDMRTIVSKRNKLPQLPLKILTPIEWWAQIKPWGGLWL